MTAYNDILIYAIIGTYVSMGIALVIWLYKSKVQVYYKAEFYRKMGKPKYDKARDVWAVAYLFVGGKNFKPDSSIVEYQRSAYLIDMKRVSVLTPRKTIIQFDVDTKEQLWMGGKIDIPHSRLGFKMLDALLGNGVFSEVFGTRWGANTGLLVIVFIMVAVAVILFFLGYISYPFLNPVNATAVGGA